MFACILKSERACIQRILAGLPSNFFSSSPGLDLVPMLGAENEASRFSATRNNVGHTADSRSDKFDDAVKIKIYKRRWLQLGLFCLFAAVNNMQWIQYTIIENVISEYYSVSSFAVDSTSLLFMIMYMLCLFPASYLMDRLGLRWSCLIGCIGTTLGAWIKVFSVSPDRFWVTFIGQALVAASQIFVMSSPPRLAAYWFGPEQVASATAIACFGCQLGIALFFWMTPIIVKKHDNIDDIGRDLWIFFLAVAIVCTAVTFALYILFKEEPKLPPSHARAVQKAKKNETKEGFLSPFRRILANKSFLMLWNCYGMNVGVLNTISTMVNPMYLAHFEHGEEDAGILGLLLVVTGLFGSASFGVLLDRTKKFRQITIFVYVCSLIGQILFAVALKMEIKWMAYGSAMILGTFMVAYTSIGFELCVEMTFPEPEALASGILNMANQVYGLGLVVLVGRLMSHYGDMAAHACLSVILTIGITVTILTKNEFRRQRATDNSNYSVVSMRDVKKETSAPLA